MPDEHAQTPRSWQARLNSPLCALHLPPQAGLGYCPSYEICRGIVQNVALAAENRSYRPATPLSGMLFAESMWKAAFLSLVMRLAFLCDDGG